ncbi:hypothetical protein [Phenylobacterium aquaticum]|uniref:hypothetical protein n=1 Tax=Phenylobacterium aquaticum TaxID=1763816 RepID=UPI0026F01877|nr:hypothetical protein [Phenylobacterium aquaticum]
MTLRRLRSSLLPALAASLMTAFPALAQAPEGAPNPVAVAVSSLAAPDFFSAAGHDTGLGPDLWKTASPETLRVVLPLLAAKPLSPAAQALARRVLATGASGPGNAGQDPTLAGVRISALIAQGGVKDADEILSKTSGLDQRPALAQAAAEAALLSNDPDRACALGDALAVGRDDIYWVRLRAYCQLRKGDAGAAQLTFDLAQGLARDPVYGRLMGAKLAGGGDPGAAALRNGLDVALSRDLGLDLGGATPSPAVAAALNPPPDGAPRWPMESGPGPVRSAMAVLAQGDLTAAQTLRASLTEADTIAAGAFDMALLDALIAAASGKGEGPALDRLVERGLADGGKLRARAQAGAVILAGLGAPLSDIALGQLASFPAVEAKGPPARMFALDQAGARPGEVALLALWTSADAGPGGPAPGDRARIIRALKAAGLETDARAFAVEGLLGVR